MKNKIWFIIFLLLISGCATGSTVKIEQIVYEGPYTVTNVVDGDTLDLEDFERIRLSGINTPETGECYYLEAKEKLEELVLNKTVYLERDITNRGNYGRLLRYIYDENKRLVNKVLVEGGYADAHDKYKDDTKRFAELDAAEQRARAKNLGMWSCVDVKVECLYIHSKNSDKYHKPDCKWVKRIAVDNRVCVKSETEIKDLEPCGTCNP